MFKNNLVMYSKNTFLIFLDWGKGLIQQTLMSAHGDVHIKVGSMELLVSKIADLIGGTIKLDPIIFLPRCYFSNRIRQHILIPIYVGYSHLLRLFEPALTSSHHVFKRTQGILALVHPVHNCLRVALKPHLPTLLAPRPLEGLHESSTFSLIDIVCFSHAAKTRDPVPLVIPHDTSAASRFVVIKFLIHNPCCIFFNFIFMNK